MQKKQLKSLPTNHTLTNQNRKRLSVRVRLLYNVLAKFDETIIRKTIECEEENLTVRYNFISDSELFSTLFR